MKNEIFHSKVRGSRFEVIVNADYLTPITYNLKPGLAGGQSR